MDKDLELEKKYLQAFNQDLKKEISDNIRNLSSDTDVDVNLEYLLAKKDLQDLRDDAGDFHKDRLDDAERRLEKIGESIHQLAGVPKAIIIERKSEDEPEFKYHVKNGLTYIE